MKTILAIALLILLVGCTEKTIEQEKEMEVNYLVSATGTEPKDDEIIRDFEIRTTAKGFSMQEIEVNEGDTVRLTVTNTISEGDVKSGRDTNDAKRFGISGYAVEGFYHTGGTLFLEFVADKSGEFEFGDEAHTERKGILIVK